MPLLQMQILLITKSCDHPAAVEWLDQYFTAVVAQWLELYFAAVVAQWLERYLTL